MSLTKVSYSMIQGAVANVLDHGASPSNTAGQNDAAFLSAFNSGAGCVYFPAGLYFISVPIQLPAGIIVIGETAGMFSSLGVTIRNNTASSGVFWMTPTTSASTQQDGPTIENFYLIADFPIKLNDPTVTIADSGAGLNPYILHPHIINVHCTGVTAGVGTGLTLAKCFDFKVELCSFTNFNDTLSIGILSIGSDIGYIGTNRILGFVDYGILEIGTGTFGSQTIIENNDILVGYANSIFIKSCGKHPRIIDNYCEASASVGAIDCTNIGCPTYGANTPASPQDIVVERNRIDGRANFTWVYRLDATTPTTATTLIDTGTTGLQGTPLLINGTYLPIRFGIYAYSKYDICIPFSVLYENFQTGVMPKISNGITFDVSNWNVFDQAYMNSSNGADKIGYNGQKEISCFPSLSGNSLTLALPAPNPSTLNHPLTVGALYYVYVTARSPLGKTLLVQYFDSTPAASSNVTLTFAPSISTQLALTVVAPAANLYWGIIITGGALQDCFIQSIEFRAVVPNPALGNYANDAAAAAGGVYVGQQYRNGSIVQIRVV